MLRPERMSKVSITGSKRVMSDVIEAVHDANLLHVRDYDGSWEGFDAGDPTDGADGLADKLVTVRSLQSILGVTEDDGGPPRDIPDEALDQRLPEIREEVNALDDRRDDLRDEARALDEQIEAVEPFADLGIDIDLLYGYDSVEVAVGEGDPEALEHELERNGDVRAFEVRSSDGVVAAFVYPSGDEENVVDDVLVATNVSRLDVPDVSGDPTEHLDDLRREREAVESKLESVRNDLDSLRSEHGGFLLAAEEQLAIEVQKREAPLEFATTKRAFVAEGWLPTESFGDLRSTVNAVDEAVEVEELERANYTETHGHSHEAVGEDDAAEARADGGHPVGEDSPPVVQDNGAAAKPFEVLVRVLDRPKYSELDPTFVLLLTFPAFYGFMIGDLAYGVLYAGIGYLLWSRFDSDAIRSLGGVAMWAGLFTMIFGVLYGEAFGFHVITRVVWDGTPPLKKGLHTGSFAQLWLTMSVVVGVFHVCLGFLMGFVNDWNAHGLKEAVLEDLSWVGLIAGLWLWIFSTQASGQKPGFLYTVFDGEPIPLGFAGFGEAVGTVGLVLAAAGLVAVVAGEGVVGALESPNALVNVISYTRLAAVLIAKAGMAFVVNLLAFGAYHVGHGGEEVTHFMFSGEAPEGATVIFGGLWHAGPIGVVGALLVLVVGHITVLALGVTSAGLQAVRLEYVEFFNKFYDGGGEKYHPFGYQRTYTEE